MVHLNIRRVLRPKYQVTLDDVRKTSLRLTDLGDFAILEFSTRQCDIVMDTARYSSTAGQLQMPTWVTD
jgi:hypothetical protein